MRGSFFLPVRRRLRARTQAQFAAQGFELLHQLFQDQADAGQGPRQTLEKNRPEQNAELAEIHVVFFCAAVIQHRAEQHFHQERIANNFAHHRPGRTAGMRLSQLIVVAQLGHQAAEVVFFPGKMPVHLRLEKFEVVVEPHA
jgi:hypothetical protein